MIEFILFYWIFGLIGNMFYYQFISKNLFDDPASILINASISAIMIWPMIIISLIKKRKS